jgi:hypothetical protein
MNIKVDTEDLRIDAENWSGFAADTQGPTADKVANLTLPDGAFPGAAMDIGVGDAYETVRSSVDTLAGEGPPAFRTVSSTLRTAAQLYDDSDLQSELDFDRV